MKQQYAYGYVSDPIQYAIDTMVYVAEMIGQDKRVTFAEVALREYQEEQVARGLEATARAATTMIVT